MKCMKCDEETEEGFTAEFGHANFVHPSVWVKGQPQKKKAFLAMDSVAVKDKKAYAITQYRCPKCGFLESYGNESVQFSSWTRRFSEKA